jgi:hypothetical protein
MSSKTFCDECEKEIGGRKYVQVWNYTEGFNIKHYCLDCFKRHWKETKKRGKIKTC